MKISSAKASRTIAATEVQEWVGKSGKSTMGEAQFREISAGLRKLRWLADPREIETDTNPWWDFEAVAEAAKVLLSFLVSFKPETASNFAYTA